MCRHSHAWLSSTSVEVAEITGGLFFFWIQNIQSWKILYIINKLSTLQQTFGGYQSQVSCWPSKVMCQVQKNVNCHCTLLHSDISGCMCSAHTRTAGLPNAAQGCAVRPEFADLNSWELWSLEHLIDHTVMDKQSPPIILAIIDLDFLLPELMCTS